MTGGGAIRTFDSVYEITIHGCPPTDWDEWFEGFAATTSSSPDGPVTTLTGPIVDQAALHGVLARCRDLALPIISVRQLDVASVHTPNTSPGT